jgi:LCP family protein required for cell wall assembly
MDEIQNEERLHKRKKRRLRWGRLIFLLLLVGLLSAACFWGSVWLSEHVLHPPQDNVVAADDKIRQDEKLNERINVLLLGIDDGDSEAAASEPKRTDAIILLSFDPKENQVAVLSIPRDTKVILPGHRDPEKINAAYAYGGAVMAKQTVANLLRVPIHYYCLADWRGFIDVVNLIGGVDLYVEKDMYYEDPYADLVIDIKHGYQHMDGETAGKYVRFRKDELGDIGRVQRQQKFLKAAAEQMFSVQNVTKVSSLLRTLDKYIQTDLNTLTMLKAANSFKIFGDDKLRSCMLYGKFDDQGGVSYWSADQESVNKSLDELGIPYIKEKSETTEVKEEAPVQHLQPKDREELYREKNNAKENTEQRAKQAG